LKHGDIQYRAFISYSHADKVVAEWLHRALEGYRIPSKLVGQTTALGEVPARLGSLFRDRDELPASGDLGAELQAALKRSMFLIVICSPAAAQSRWVNEEVRQFKMLHGRKRGDGTARVLALIASGNPGDAEAGECFPPALKFHVAADGSITDDPAEPIAADIRPGGDGRKLAKLKLVAGLTGLPLDALVQREAVRRQQRLGLVSSASLVLTAVMAVLTVLALQGRREAERQRAQADGLIEFMLTDLREKLEPVGRLEVLDSVGQKALAYYAAQKLKALDPDELGRRARALHLVGEVRDLRGDSEGALKAFHESERTTAELLARDPDNPDRMFDHAQSVFWVGYMAWQRADQKSSEAQFRNYNRLASALVARDPGNPKWRTEQASAQTNLAIWLEEGKRSDEAVPLFRSAVAIHQRLVAEQPSDIERRKVLGQAQAWLSDALRRRGALSEAIALRQAELTLYTEMLAEDPERADAGIAMAVTQQRLSELQLLRAETDEAERRAASALSTALALVVRDPEDSFARDIAAGAANSRTEALMADGRWRAARAQNDRALMLAQQLVESDPANRFWRQGRLMPARWMDIAIAFGLRDATAARAALKRFADDFAAERGLTQPDTLREAWAMVAALAFHDCELRDTRCQTIWGKQLHALMAGDLSPRMQALQSHLAAGFPRSFPPPALPAPAPAGELRYPVGVILNP
jgi:tetratricopeptide (TPR) repeat protein